MKIRIEQDAAYKEEEIIIHCAMIHPRLQKLIHMMEQYAISLKYMITIKLHLFLLMKYITWNLWTVNHRLYKSSLL